MRVCGDVGGVIVRVCGNRGDVCVVIVRVW